MSFVKLQFMVERGMPTDLKVEVGKHFYLIDWSRSALSPEETKKDIASIDNMLKHAFWNDCEWMVNKDGYLFKSLFGSFMENKKTGKTESLELVKIDLKPWINSMPHEQGVKALLALRMIPKWVYGKYYDAFPCLKLKDDEYRAELEGMRPKKAGKDD